MFKFQSDPARVRRLLRMEETDMTKDARRRLQWFAYCLEHESNVSLTCRYFGIARSTFVRWATRFDPLDPETLEEHSRRPKHFREPETPEATVALIKSLRECSPHMSREAIVQTLHDVHGINISSASVGRVIRRYALFFANTPSHARKRREIEPLPFLQNTLSANGETEREPGEQTDGLSFAPTSALVIALAVISLIFGGLLAPTSVHASGSDSFSIDEGNMASGSDFYGSDSYSVDDSSVSWTSDTGDSDSYQTGGSDGSGTGGSDGGSSGGTSGGSSGGDSGGGSQQGGGHRGNQDEQGTEQHPSEDTGGGGHAAPVERLSSVRVRTRSLLPSGFSPFASAINIDLKGIGIGDAMKAQSGFSPYDYSAALPHFFSLNDSPDTAFENRVSTEEKTGLRSTALQYASSVRRDIALLATNIVTYATLLAGYWVMRSRGIVLVSEGLLANMLKTGRHRIPSQLRSTKKSSLQRKSRKNAKQTKKGFKRTFLSVILLFALCIGHLQFAPKVQAARTVPQYITYNGRLKNASGTAITTNHYMRFSFWSDADAVALDLLGDGTIDTSRPNYAGWQEVHLAKPNSSGYFTIKLGSGTALPELQTMTRAQLQNLHMQVEVKQVGQADTSFEILDVNTTNPAIDRTAMQTVPFAFNADLLDQRDTGTASGSIAVLGPGNVYPTSVIPGGTNSGSFVIDKDSSEASTIKLQFGQSLGKALSYDIGAGLFNFNDDVRVQGNLTVTGFINGVDIQSLTPAQNSHLRVSSGAVLKVDVAGGSYRLNGDVTNYAGTTDVALTDNTTNYVFFGSGGLKVSTVGLPTDESAIPLATVVTSGGAITSVADRRVLQSDNRERAVSERYSAGFEHVVFQGDAASNVGQMSEQHDSSNIKNYYQWTSSISTLQDYDVIVRVPVSADFVGWVDNPLQVQYRSTSGDSANAKLDITVFDTNGNPVILSGSTTNLANTEWTTAQIEFTGIAGGPATWTPATEFLIKFKASAKDNFQIHLGGFLLKFRELITD